MSLFGEINLPVSRALWDDDYEEFYETIDNISLDWDTDTALPKGKIDTLLVIETNKLIKLAKACLVDTRTPVCKIASINLNVYKVAPSKYIILYENNSKVTAGEIVEKIAPWIEKSCEIITFNSAPSANYQCNSNEEKPTCFIRSLSTGQITVHAAKLEAPNLGTGLAAGVLSYCRHYNLPASMYICFMEPTQLDSLSAEPILNIFRKLQICNIKPYRVNSVDNDSFLYM